MESEKLEQALILKDNLQLKKSTFYSKRYVTVNQQGEFIYYKDQSKKELRGHYFLKDFEIKKSDKKGEQNRIILQNVNLRSLSPNSKSLLKKNSQLLYEQLESSQNLNSTNNNSDKKSQSSFQQNNQNQKSSKSSEKLEKQEKQEKFEKIRIKIKFSKNEAADFWFQKMLEIQQIVLEREKKIQLNNQQIENLKEQYFPIKNDSGQRDSEIEEYNNNDSIMQNQDVQRVKDIEVLKNSYENIINSYNNEKYNLNDKVEVDSSTLKKSVQLNNQNERPDRIKKGSAQLQQNNVSNLSSSALSQQRESRRISSIGQQQNSQNSQNQIHKSQDIIKTNNLQNKTPNYQKLVPVIENFQLNQKNKEESLQHKIDRGKFLSFYENSVKNPNFYQFNKNKYKIPEYYQYDHNIDLKQKKEIQNQIDAFLSNFVRSNFFLTDADSYGLRIYTQKKQISRFGLIVKWLNDALFSLVYIGYVLGFLYLMYLIFHLPFVVDNKISFFSIIFFIFLYVLTKICVPVYEFTNNKYKKIDKLVGKLQMRYNKLKEGERKEQKSFINQEIRQGDGYRVISQKNFNFGINEVLFALTNNSYYYRRAFSPYILDTEIDKNQSLFKQMNIFNCYLGEPGNQIENQTLKQHIQQIVIEVKLAKKNQSDQINENEKNENYKDICYWIAEKGYTPQGQVEIIRLFKIERQSIQNCLVTYYGQSKWDQIKIQNKNQTKANKNLQNTQTQANDLVQNQINKQTENINKTENQNQKETENKTETEIENNQQQNQQKNQQQNQQQSFNSLKVKQLLLEEIRAECRDVKAVLKVQDGVSAYCLAEVEKVLQEMGKDLFSQFQQYLQEKFDSINRVEVQERSEEVKELEKQLKIAIQNQQEEQMRNQSQNRGEVQVNLQDVQSAINLAKNVKKAFKIGEVIFGKK